MADISNGPVSTLPGHSAGVPVGIKCDEHPDEMPFAVSRGKQIRLVVNITTCARNATMNMFVKPIAPTIQGNAIGAVNTSNV